MVVILSIRRLAMKTALKSIAFVSGWIITASIGLWAMALYGMAMAIVGGRA